MYFFAGGSQHLCFLGDFLYLKQKFLFHLKRVGSDYLIPLHHLDVIVDCCVEHYHE
jgi:hypothetical protein